MLAKKKEHPKEKSKLHPRNKHRERYNFEQLIMASPELAPFVKLNAYKDESIDFFNPAAVKILNKALLKYFYSIDYWDIPPNYLCPPIPGRADYIHHIADVLSSCNGGKIPRGEKIKCLDIGIGANCVYPIIGAHEYEWSFVGSDINTVALDSANKIIEINATLKGKIECRKQAHAEDIFKGIILNNELFDLTICNPPFHTSLTEALAGTHKKLNNLKKGRAEKYALNFGGQNNELWCKGGEAVFLQNMIGESKQFAMSCFWFSSLVSKQTTLAGVYWKLKKTGAIEVKTITMGQGNKTSRIVAWTFLTREQQKNWATTRWKK